jgi:hypothetical protein
MKESTPLFRKPWGLPEFLVIVIVLVLAGTSQPTTPFLGLPVANA